MLNKNDYTRFTGGVADRLAIVTGGSAGDHTVSGLSRDDKLKSVHYIGYDSSGNAMEAGDITDEFDIPDDEDEVINNDDGTDTSDQLLVVAFVDVDRGLGDYPEEE